MLKLLKGSFIRLFRSSEFQIMPFLLMIMNFMMIFMERANLQDTDTLPGLPLFNAFFHVMILSICTSAFVALFIGAEYSNATIFNKIIFGHSRTAVYLTYLLTCLFGTAMFHLTATGVTTLIGWIALGKPTFTFGVFISGYLLSLPALFASTALHLAITIIVQNRAVAVGVSATLSTIMLFFSMYFCDGMHYENKYLDFLPDFYLNKLAMSDTLISSGIIEKLNFPVYPCILFSLFTVIGLIVFNNINIRNTPEGEI